MIYSINGKPVRDIRMHRRTYKQIAESAKTYRHSMRLLAALVK